jgi:hypothetical protein
MESIVFCVALGVTLAGLLFFMGAFIGKKKGKVPFISRPERWAIGIYSGVALEDLTPHPPTQNPVLTAGDISDREADFVADPFMLRHEGTWFLFFEIVDAKSKTGIIGLAISTDLTQWQYQGVVLQEPFHLSYPYVFKHNDDFYMVPESHAAHSVRLYRATQFPSEWTLEHVLLPKGYHDPTLFRHGDLWWMFVSEWHDTLRLFFADTLDGSWCEHPQSPIVHVNKQTARPAGRVVQDKDYLVRFSQDCTLMYGEQVYAFAITKLTRSEYRETELAPNPVLNPESRSSWSHLRMHHLDAHRMGDEGWVACVDGDRRHRLKVSLPGGMSFSI